VVLHDRFSTVPGVAHRAEYSVLIKARLLLDVIEVAVCSWFHVRILVRAATLSVLDYKHSDALSEVGFVHHGLLHLGGPHQERANNGDDEATHDTGPVDEKGKDL